MSLTLSGSGAPRLQRSWDSRAACNFIGGGSGAGLLVVAAASLLAGRPYLPAGILAIALIGFGLSMVWLEIGRPLRALNVFFHPQTSWMTREALLALPVLGFAALAVLLDQRSAPLPFPARVPIAISASLAALLGLAFLYCQARILRASVGIPAWREPALQWVIIVAGIAEGLGLLLVLGIFGVTPPSWAVPVGILAVAARAGAWQHYRRRVKLIGPAQSITALDRVLSTSSSFRPCVGGGTPRRNAYDDIADGAGSHRRPHNLRHRRMVEVGHRDSRRLHAGFFSAICAGQRERLRSRVSG